MKVVNTCLLGAGLAALVACGGGGKDDPPVRKPPVPKVFPKTRAVAPVSGKLTDRTTSLALANVTVTAQSVNVTRILDTAVTKADGTYTLGNVPLGVPVRVVSQPVTGAVVYATEMSETLTLLRGAAPRQVDLAFSSLPLGGAVEGTIPATLRKVTSGGLTLVHKVVLPDGKTVKAVVRTAPHKPGAFRFEALQRRPAPRRGTLVPNLEHRVNGEPP